MKSLLVVLVLAVSNAVHASDEVSQAVAAYFQDFNRDLDASELVEAHWLSSVILYTPDDVIVFGSRSETASWLQGIKASMSEAGWVRTEVVESTVCMLGEAQALSSVRFKRVFADDTESVASGLYTLHKSDKWRIASLALIDPDKRVRCE